MSLNLPQLPERKPVKVTCSLSPELRDLLLAYATLYEETYGVKESVENMIPFIVAHFLEKDRHFQKSLKAQASSPRKPATSPPTKTEERK